MSLAAGTNLGPYRIVGLLGAGGMGEVYRATDTRLGRQVAVKVLKESLAEDSRLRRRLEREARTLSQLQHPHLCMLLDVGGAEESPSAPFYLVMELLEGATLEAELRRGPLPLDDALRIGREIAEAMEAGHRRGVVHRDLKPGNVMLTAHGAKVLDFGLAKDLDATALDSTTHSPTLTALSAEGVLAGTLPYMAPEQLEGEPADARTDLWALGCVLHEMVAGQRPFRGDTQASLIGAIMQSQPEPVSRLQPLSPDRLDWVVGRCLEKDPERRWQSARDVAIELEAIERAAPAPVAADEPLAAALAPTRPAMRRTGGPGPRRRIAARRALLATVAAAAVAAIAVPWWIRVGARSDHSTPVGGRGVESAGAAPVPAAPASDRPMIVVLPFENLGDPEQAYFAAGVSEEIRSKLAALVGLGVISRSSAAHCAETGKSIRQMGDELGVDYVLDGSVRWAGERVRIQPQLVRVADDTQIWGDETFDRLLSVDNLLAIQSEIAERVARQIDESLLRTTAVALRGVGSAPGAFPRSASSSAASGAPVSRTASIEAYQAYLRGIAVKGQYTLRGAQQASPMFERAVELDPGFALAWANLAEVYSQLFHFGDQGAERRAAVDHAVERAAALAPDLPEVHRALGQYHNLVTRRLDPALRELELATAGLPNDDGVFSAMSFLYFQRGDFVQGISLIERAHRLDPTSTTNLYNTGWPRMYLRQYERADEVFTRVIAMDPETGLARWARAWNTAQWKGYEAAGALTSEQALLRWRIELARTLGRWDEALSLIDGLPDDGEVWTNYTIPKDLHRAWVHRNRGSAALAAEHFESARRTLEQLLTERPQDDRVHSALGHAYAGLGRKEEAIRHGLRGFELKPPAMNATNGVFRLQDLAMIYALVGEQEKALDCLEDLLGRPAPFSVRTLEADPAFGSLREHPRYRRLIDAYR